MIPYPYESPIPLSPRKEPQEPNIASQLTTEQAEPDGLSSGRGRANKNLQTETWSYAGRTRNINTKYINKNKKKIEKKKLYLKFYVPVLRSDCKVRVQRINAARFWHTYDMNAAKQTT